MPPDGHRRFRLRLKRITRYLAQTLMSVDDLGHRGFLVLAYDRDWRQTAEISPTGMEDVVRMADAPGLFAAHPFELGHFEE